MLALVTLDSEIIRVICRLICSLSCYVSKVSKMKMYHLIGKRKKHTNNYIRGQYLHLCVCVLGFIEVFLRDNI